MQGGETVAQRYERNMSRLVDIVKAGNLVVTKWECARDRDKVTERKPEMLTHPHFVAHYFKDARRAVRM
jgi:hypothetical protein